MTLLYFLIALCAVYILLTLFATYMVHQYPRHPVHEHPDWGHVIDTCLPAKDGGSIEVWRVEPDEPSHGIVLLAHGWSRNRDRMVGRARIFADMGFSTVLHSARDHGHSSPHRFMNAFRFAEDIETVLKWIDEPVLLYGHSVGAAAAIIAAHRHPAQIKLLFLEGCYARTKEALLSMYRSFNSYFGFFLGRMVIFWMDLFYRRRLDDINPARLASGIDLPVLIIHGGNDRSFPLRFAWQLRDSFPAGRAELFVAKGSDHSSSSLDPAYPAAMRAFVERNGFY